MSENSSKLCALACEVLRRGANVVAPEVLYDTRGYAPRWEDNVLPGLPLAEIRADLEAGAGRELDGKLCAAHSSTALVVNTFGPFRMMPAGLCLSGAAGFSAIRFEAQFPTGLGGTPPHLDLVAEGDTVVVVESKCTEWMSNKPASFSPSYDRLRNSFGDSPWYQEMLRLRAEPRRYHYLDAAQLVKHAFGLMNRYGRRPVRLVYLYWEPLDAIGWAECLDHRREADALAAAVRNSQIQLQPMSYHELWEDWGRGTPPPHLGYLRRRYALNMRA